MNYVVISGLTSITENCCSCKWQRLSWLTGKLVLTWLSFASTTLASLCALDGHWLFCRDICQPFDKCSYSHILPYIIYQDRTQSQDRPSYSYELNTCTSAFAPADPVKVEALVTSHIIIPTRCTWTRYNRAQKTLRMFSRKLNFNVATLRHSRLKRFHV